MVLRCRVIHETVELLSRNLQAATEHAAIMETEPGRLSTYNAEAADLARKLFAILVALCNPRRAVNILMIVERLQWNGSMVEAEVRVRFPGRHANMLSDLIAPDYTKCAAEAFKERFLQSCAAVWSTVV